MPLTADELEPLLRLALVQGVGPHRLARLVDRFGSADRVLAARPRELLGIAGIGPELARRIGTAGSDAAGHEARGALRTLRSLGAVALVPTDPLYPPAFTTLAEPPYLLFAIGDPDAIEAPAIAVVGTRAPTHYGRRAAGALSCELALAGYSIVSGMARGIDAAAHSGALDAGGSTVGVLGHGIEQIYPPENRGLFERVRERGLLLTEYPPGETPKAGNFPRRNRLITALADAVLVVEMGHRSGAQHTVGYALEQGKDVFAVPGPIGSAASMGTNQLIRDGAPLVTCADDVLEELRGVGARLRGDAGSRPADGAAGSIGATPVTALSESEARVLAVLSPEPVHVDDLARMAGFTPSDLLAVLLDLELRGAIAALPGKRFTRA